MQWLDRWWVGHLVAIVATAAGLLLRLAIVRSVGELPTYITFYPAIMVVAVLVGFGPGLLATALAALVAIHAIIPPTGSFRITSPADAVGLGLFCVMGALMSLVGGLVRRKELGPSAKWQRNTWGIAAVCAALAVVTLGSAFVVYWAGVRVATADAELNRIRGVMDTLEDTLSTMTDAETGQRDFLLTGEDRYLRPYEAALGRIAEDLDRLRQWGASGNIPGEKVEAIANLTHQELAELSQTIQLRREKGFEAAAAVVRSDAGKRTMEELRGRVGALEAQQNRLLNTWRQRHDRDTRLRTALVAILAVIEVLFLAWAFRRIVGGLAATERAAAELAHQRGLLTVTLASIGDAVLATDARGYVTFLNPEAERLTGWTDSEAAGQPLAAVFNIVNEETRRQVESPVDKVLRLGMVVGLANHTLLIARDGRETPIDDSGAPIRQTGGAVQGVVLVFRDVTEQRKAQTALRESEERYRSFLQASAQVVWTTNALGEVEMDLPAWQAYTGQTAEQARGMGWMNAIRPEDRDRVADAWRRASESRTLYEVEYLLRIYDGSWQNILARGVPVLNADGTVREYIGTCIDITDQRRAEAALRESLKDLNRAQAVAHTGSWRLNVWSHELLWSDEIHRIFGIPKGTPLTYETFLGAVHPDDRERVNRQWQAALRGEPYDIEHRIVVDGQVKWIREKAELEFDEQGNLLGGFGTAQDITTQKWIEEALAAAKTSAEQAKAAAEEASRAKDHFLAVLSHELRTPLTPVLAAVSLLQADPKLNPDLRESLEMVRRNAELEARLIDDLLDVTRISRGKVELDKRPVELCEVIRRAVEVCKPDIEARHLEFSVDLGPAAPYIIEADAARLQQVFWNLIKNAVKFTPHGGCVGIRCRPDSDHHVVAEVNDSGEGIEPDALARIFNAFEQAERSIARQFGGLGLGLTISKALVEMHGGTIEAQSPGKGLGATFRIRLPLKTPKSKVLSPESRSRPEARVQYSAPGTQDSALGTPASALRTQHSAPSTPLRVLLVEDHGDTAQIMARVLSRQGHEVQTAGDVATALELAARHHFDLLVSDLGLPDRTGVDLIRELRARGQTMPAIALSGYGQEEDIRRSREAGFTAHLTKPVNFEQFYRTIAAVLE